jgi:hypothetical protein
VSCANQLQGESALTLAEFCAINQHYARELFWLERAATADVNPNALAANKLGIMMFESK